ncbi:DUF2637 domain-containing protein [Micromonospora purpureochromogenes]|uniref:DUF2637 domain-containing protein n=1 Tax=Micromonospora purpureochromogenes TaxID=47872 RepID=UPI0033E72BA5
MSATPTPASAGSGRQVGLDQLRRLRWAVRAVLVLGVAASIAANVLHARPNTISQMISAWPPLALLLTVELISRVPSNRRALAVLRLLAAAVIAGIAGWVSYWHMVGVAVRYGEADAGASYLLPVSVDGLVVVASISLVEITGRIRATTMAPSTVIPEASHSATPNIGREQPTASPAPPAITRSPTHQPAAARASDGQQPDHAATTEPVPTTGRGATPPRTDQQERTPGPQMGSRTIDRLAHPSAQGRPSHTDARGGTSAQTADDEPVPSDTAAAVAYWYRRDPAMHPADIAARIGRSERTVRRYWPPPGAGRGARMDPGRTLNHA